MKRGHEELHSAGSSRAQGLGVPVESESESCHSLGRPLSRGSPCSSFPVLFLIVRARLDDV